MNPDRSLKQRVDQRRQEAFECEVERQAAEKLEESERLERSLLKTPEEQIAKSLDDLKISLMLREPASNLPPKRSWLKRLIGERAVQRVAGDERFFLGSYESLDRRTKELIFTNSMRRLSSTRSYRTRELVSTNSMLRMSHKRSYMMIDLPPDEEQHEASGTTKYYWSIGIKTGPRPPGASSWQISRIAESEQGKESIQAFKINTHVDRKNYIYRSNTEAYQEDGSWSAPTPDDQLFIQSLIHQAKGQLKSES
jgi:hypothetical protein